MRRLASFCSARTLAGCVMAAAVTLAVGLPAQATPPPLGPASAATAITKASPAAPAAFRTFPGRLYAVKAVSATNVWAVGLASTGGALILHWNGTRWTASLNPPGYFVGVAAPSARDVWAVGGTKWFTGSQPLAMHWNGTRWASFPTASLGHSGGYFNSVVATSATNAWAVGLLGPAGPGIPSLTAPLVEHWNGARWTVQQYQQPSEGGQFTAVVALSRTNAWAVGQTGPSSEGLGQHTLIEHWNGSGWFRVASPDYPGASANSLRGVVMVSASNGWADGVATMPDGSMRTLTLFWNGRRWRVVPSPTPGGDAALLGIAASWTNNIWAVGIINPTRCGNGGYTSQPCRTLIMHWNGTRWKVVPSPNPPSTYLNVLYAATAVTRDSIWAAGSTDFASTLIIHWNGKAWS